MESNFGMLQSLGAMGGILFSHFEEVDIGNEEVATIVTTKINETTLEVWQPLKNQDEVQVVENFVAWQVRYVIFANNFE